MEIKNQLNHGHAAAGLCECQETNHGLEDRISCLPDDILVSILTYLTINEAARTCILSHRWEKLWKFTTKLVFDDSRTWSSKFVGWVNKVLKSHKGQIVDEFRISCCSLDENYSSVIKHWIIIAAKKKVKVLELNFLGKGSRKGSSYRYPSLIDESFRISKMAGKPGSRSFSSLTSLCLNSVVAYSQSMEYFLCNCPSLERLCLHRVYDLQRLTISGSNSLKLKHLEITCCRDLKSLQISATSLVSFMFDGCGTTELSLKSTPSLVELFIAGLNCDKDFILKLFSNSLSQLTKLTLKCEGMQLDFPENFPPLINLKQLELHVTEFEDQSILPWLDLIEACPMLSRLKMKTSQSMEFKGSLEWKAAKESHKNLQVVEMVRFIAFSTAGEFLINLIHNTASLKKIIIDPPKHYTKLSFLNERDFEVEARRFHKKRLKVALKMAPSVEVVII